MFSIALASEPPELVPWASWSGPFPLRAGETVEADTAHARSGQESITTVHLILQIHADPANGEYSPEAKSCQDKIVSTVLSNARKGATSVVLEGLPFQGSAQLPEPYPQSVLLRALQDEHSAITKLAKFEGLALYGFESPHHDVGGNFIAIHSEQESISAYTADTEWFQNASLFMGVNVPLRSFEALQAALLIAQSQKVDQVQIVIGRAHDADFLYAMGRDPYPAYRFIPYYCQD